MIHLLTLIFMFIATSVSAQINIVSSSIPGGGSDVQARVIAKHLSKHLPNNPRVNVINMQGAGGLTMANWMYNVADPQNHIAILTVNNDVLISGILQDRNAKYDLSKFKWLFSAEDGDDNVFVLWANTGRGLTNVSLLQIHNPFIIGNPGPNNIQTYFLEEIIQSQAKIVYGYKDIIRALQINEIDARFGTLLNARARYPDWLKKGNDIQPILQVGSFRRHPFLPDVPNVREFARTDEHRQILDYYERNVRLARLVFGPPGMSDETVRMIVNAAIALEKDKEFIEDAKKLEMGFDFIHHDETNRLMNDLLNTNKDMLRKITAQKDK